MLKVSRSESEGGRLAVQAAGELTVEEAVQMKEALVAALGSPAAQLDLDCSGLTQMDVAGVQLICSAHKSAMKAGKKLQLLGLRPELAADIYAAGFRHLSGCMGGAEGHCLWSGCEPGESGRREA